VCDDTGNVPPGTENLCEEPAEVLFIRVLFAEAVPSLFSGMHQLTGTGISH